MYNVHDTIGCQQAKHQAVTLTEHHVLMLVTAIVTPLISEDMDLN
jgi:hypothetical protein